MQVPTESQLVEKIEEACERHDIKPSRLLRDANADPNLLHEIKNKGRSPSLKVVQQVLAHIAALDAEQAAAEGDLNKAAEAARRVA